MPLIETPSNPDGRPLPDVIAELVGDLDEHYEVTEAPLGEFVHVMQERLREVSQLHDEKLQREHEHAEYQAIHADDEAREEARRERQQATLDEANAHLEKLREQGDLPEGKWVVEQIGEFKRETIDGQVVVSMPGWAFQSPEFVVGAGGHRAQMVDDPEAPAHLTIARKDAAKFRLHGWSLAELQAMAKGQTR